MSPPQEEEVVSDSIEPSVIRVSRAAAAESSVALAIISRTLIYVETALGRT